jgi:hypothetical protein
VVVLSAVILGDAFPDCERLLATADAAPEIYA